MLWQKPHWLFFVITIMMKHLIQNFHQWAMKEDDDDEPFGSSVVSKELPPVLGFTTNTVSSIDTNEHSYLMSHAQPLDMRHHTDIESIKQTCRDFARGHLFRYAKFWDPETFGLADPKKGRTTLFVSQSLSPVQRKCSKCMMLLCPAGCCNLHTLIIKTMLLRRSKRLTLVSHHWHCDNCSFNPLYHIMLYTNVCCVIKRL